jgi:Uma2 family endonuclease
MTWQQLCEDKRFANLPFKIELSRTGKIIMSPTRNRHGYFQGQIAILLKQHLPHGETIVECAVDTPEGTIVADATWASAERFKIIENEFSCSIAPEICVEVWSPSDTREELAMKRQLYLSKGAVEVWFCDDQGQLAFYNAQGELAESRICPGFPKKIPS